MENSLNHSLLEQKLQTEAAFKNGANWFFWIAGLSVINSLIITFGGEMSFVIGLGITQFIDGISIALKENGSNAAAYLLLIPSLIIAGIAAMFGYFARRKQAWSFITGMVLYGLDGLIFLAFGDFLPVAFHAFALWGIFRGYKAMKELEDINRRIAEASVETETQTI